MGETELQKLRWQKKKADFNNDKIEILKYIKENVIMETVKEINKASCEEASIESWAAWSEGEEGWG